MNDFIRKPLLKRLNKQNFDDRLRKVEARTGPRNSLQTVDVGNIAAVMSAVRFYAIDADAGVVRMAMSGTNLTDEFGVNANLSGFDNIGAATFYVDATTGALTVGSGAIALDANGITFDNTAGVLRFKNVAGVVKIRVFGDNNDDYYVQNDEAGKAIKHGVTLTDLSVAYLKFREDPATANVSQLDLTAGSAGGKISIGTDVVIWAGADGRETVFNGAGKNNDFRIKGDTVADVFLVDASEDRVEFGLDNIISNRNAANPNTYFNEANQDMDFIVRSTTNDNMLVVDAGLDAIGVAGAAETGWDLKVTGTLKVTSTMDFAGGGLAVSTTAAVINEDSRDMDFRVESNGNANMLVVDGGLDAVGVGAAAVSGQTLTVAGSVVAADSNIFSRFDTIADDNVVSFTPSKVRGAIRLSAVNANVYGYVAYNTVTPNITGHILGSLVEVATGALTGTTGTDAKLTVSCHTDGKIYIENRLGGARIITTVLE